MKRYKFLIDEDNKYRLCRRLGIYYFEYKKIELFTLYISIKTKRIFALNSTNLPTNIYKKYQGEYVTKNIKLELEKLGIFPYNDIKNLIDSHNNSLDTKEIEKYMLENEDRINEDSEIHSKLEEIQDALIKYNEGVKMLIKR